MTGHEVCACDRDDLAAKLLPKALRFVGIVHDEGPDTAAAAYAEIPDSHRDAFAVILAALVPMDRSAQELLEWIGQNAAADAVSEFEAVLSGMPYSDDEADWTRPQLRFAWLAYKRGNRDARVKAGWRIYGRIDRAERRLLKAVS